jgi:hypothetical protein
MTFWKQSVISLEIRRRANSRSDFGNSAREVLQKLFEINCNEEFYVTMKFPKEVIEQRKQGPPG